MADNKAAVRKRPQQDRAQQRFDLILDAAESLIRHKQSCQFGMNGPGPPATPVLL